MSLDSHHNFDATITHYCPSLSDQNPRDGGGGGASIWISPSMDFDRQVADRNLHDRQGFVAK